MKTLKKIKKILMEKLGCCGPDGCEKCGCCCCPPEAESKESTSCQPK